MKKLSFSFIRIFSQIVRLGKNYGKNGEKSKFISEICRKLIGVTAHTDEFSSYTDGVSSHTDGFCRHTDGFCCDFADILAYTDGF